MSHRPATLITFKLIIAMRKAGMSRKQIALDLNMSEDNVKSILFRVNKDRRKKPRPDSVDRRQANQQNAPELQPDKEQDVA